MSRHYLSRRRAISRGLVAAYGVLLGLSSPLPTFAQESDPSQDSPSSSTASAPSATPSSSTSSTMPPGDAPAPDFSAGPGDGATVPSPDADGGDTPPPIFAPEPEVVATGPWGVPPIKLAFPSLGLEAPIVPVGQDEDGAMSAPSDPDTVAWYQFGPGMGVAGNVVLAGHVNWNGRTRAFGHLDELEVGDPILVIDTDGHGYQYVIESSRWVRAEGAPVEEIFASTGETIVTMITCGGQYVAATREYLDRLIVRAKGA